MRHKMRTIEKLGIFEKRVDGTDGIHLFDTEEDRLETWEMRTEHGREKNHWEMCKVTINFQEPSKGKRKAW
jgi:hypothetical protein